MKIIFFLFVFILLGGCASAPEKVCHKIHSSPGSDLSNDWKTKHVIQIASDGNLESSNEADESRCKGVSDNGMFDSIFKEIKKLDLKNKNGKKEILIYIHGGLNTKEDSLTRAEKFYGKIMDSKKYPIFVNWDSDPVRTYKAHLTKIRHGEYSSTVRSTAPVYLLTDVVNSIINAPKCWLIQQEHSRKSTIERKPDYETEIECFAKNNKENPNKIKFYYTKDNEKFSPFWRSIRWSLTSPFKFITTPFACTLPRSAWDIMLRRTNTMFRRECDFDRDSGHGQQGTGALSVFLRKFENEFRSELEKKNIEITLIGHSMGAIIVNKMINLHPDLPYKNIVHMASADSMRNFMALVVPYIRSHPDVNFYSLSLHPENENREESAIKKIILTKGLLPSGSLLVWIDHMYTTPETIMDRRSGRWDNMKRILHMIRKTEKNNDVEPEKMSICQDTGAAKTEDERIREETGQSGRKLLKAPLDRMHFKVFGRGNPCEPQEHGDFDDYDFWNRSYWTNEEKI